MGLYVNLTASNTLSNLNANYPKFIIDGSNSNTVIEILSVYYIPTSLTGSQLILEPVFYEGDVATPQTIFVGKTAVGSYLISGLNKAIPKISKVFLGAISDGPLQEAVVGAGSYFELFGVIWKLTWDGTQLKLLRSTDSGITFTDATSIGTLPVLDATQNQLSLAFDQAGRTVVSWQQGTKIYYQKYDLATNSYIQTGGYDGLTPALLNEASVNYKPDKSNVLLFYVDPATPNALSVRKQNTLFNVPEVLKTFPVPVKITSIETPAYRYKVNLTSLDDTQTFEYMSPLYDIYLAADKITGSLSGILMGEFKSVVVSSNTAVDSLSSTIVATLSLNFYSEVIIKYLETSTITGTIAPNLTASFNSVVLSTSLEQTIIGSRVTTATGALFKIEVAQTTLSTATINSTITASITGVYGA